MTVTGLTSDAASQTRSTQFGRSSRSSSSCNRCPCIKPVLLALLPVFFLLLGLDVIRLFGQAGGAQEVVQEHIGLAGSLQDTGVVGKGGNV